VKKRLFLSLLLLLLCSGLAAAETQHKTDVISTASGDLEITFIGHASLMLRFNHRIIHIDPFSRMADYSKLPKADLILITHEHRDHLDLSALSMVRTEHTVIVLNRAAAEQLGEGRMMENGDVRTVLGLKIEAVPAYSILHMRGNGLPFHPRGNGNGYVITFGDKKIYVAGDTENTPEMKRLTGIDIAFLPMNLPYTMTPEMVADAARSFRPAILYPYHYGDTDTSRLVEVMRGVVGIEVRIR